MRQVPVLLDGYFLGKPYGFGRYAGELLHALTAHPDGFPVALAVPRDRMDAVVGSWVDRVEVIPVRPGPLPLWEQVLLPATARRVGAGLTHSLYNTGPWSSFGSPTVLTVHDLMFLGGNTSPPGTKRWAAHLYAQRAFGRSARTARALVAVSDHTRSQLGALGLASTVVPNSVDLFATTTVAEPARWTEGGPWFLHRGGSAEHRNTARVIQAFTAAGRRTGPDHRLLVLGLAPDEREQFAGLDLAAVDFLPRVTDGQLVTLYRGATGVVATSIEEGFGLPLIEGFAFDAPVISSTRPPMAEIAGDAALLVDPLQVDQIAGAIHTLMTEPACRTELVTRGRVRRQDFGSQRLAEGMTAVYRQALAGGPAAHPVRRPSVR